MSCLSAVRTAFVASCSLFLALESTQAQGPLVVRPLQDLSFGFLIPGVNTTVDALQLTRSGQVEVQATVGAVLEVRYTLPAVMNSGANTLPLAFGATSAGASASRTPIDVVRFNPNVATRFRYVTTDRATFFLGGLASPRTTQVTGAYTAPVIITITNLGF